MTKDEALTLALEALEAIYTVGDVACVVKPEGEIYLKPVIDKCKEALAQPEQESVLQDIEQYRLQMAGISTAAIGYWKEGDGIHPDYDTLALRDVAKLYSKYDELYKAQPEQEPWLLESTQTLAKTLAREFYPEVTQWECLNDLAGVISQIDNMTTGLMRKPEPHPTGCACRWDAEGDRVVTCARHEGWLEVIVEWADRAREAEKKLKALAQPEYQSTAEKSKLEKVPAKGTLLAQPERDPWREAVAQPEERNFCSRCGKRLASGFVEISIHTCTPPQPEQEPKTYALLYPQADYVATPDERPWVGLTDEEVKACLGPEAVRIPPGWSKLARAIEAKLKEKNT